MSASDIIARPVLDVRFGSVTVCAFADSAILAFSTGDNRMNTGHHLTADECRAIGQALVNAAAVMEAEQFRRAERLAVARIERGHLTQQVTA